MLTKFKLFGLQRSGTNVTQWLIKENLEVQSVEKGGSWKHGKIDKEYNEEDVAIVIVTKNLFSWLRSCHAYFKNHGGDKTVCNKFQKSWTLSDFISNPHYEWKTPIHRYLDLNIHWVQFSFKHSDRSIIVPSEALLSLEDQEKVVWKLSTKFQWKLKHDKIKTATKRVNNHCSLDKNAFDFDFYCYEQFMSAFSKDDLKFIGETTRDWK